MDEKAKQRVQAKLQAIEDGEAPVMGDAELFKPMTVDELEKIDDNEKLQILASTHQAILKAVNDAGIIGQAVVKMFDEIEKYNRTARTKAGARKGMKVRHPNSIMVMVMGVDDVMLPPRLQREWAKNGIEYGAFCINRHDWTGGRGALKWPRKHPYKKLIREVSIDPPPGKLWALVFASQAATHHLIGAMPDAPSGQEPVYAMPEAPKIQKTVRAHTWYFAASKTVGGEFAGNEQMVALLHRLWDRYGNARPAATPKDGFHLWVRLTDNEVVARVVYPDSQQQLVAHNVQLDASEVAEVRAIIGDPT